MISQILSIQIAKPFFSDKLTISDNKIALADTPPMPRDLTSFSISNTNVGHTYGTLLDLVEKIVPMYAPEQADNIKNGIKAKTVDVMWVNNDFGKGGRDMIVKALEAEGIKVGADISTDPGQVDFSSAVLKAKQSNGDALFVYTNEEESASALRGLRVVRYAAWIAHRWHDPIFPATWSEFGTDEWWGKETDALEEILRFARGQGEAAGWDEPSPREELPEGAVELTNRDYFWDWEEKK